MRPPIRTSTILLLVLPLVLLAGVVWLFLSTGGGLRLTAPAPVEALTIERTVLNYGEIELHLRNAGPQPLQIAQVIVNDAIWPFRISPSAEISRLGSAVLHLDYHWTLGESYHIRLLSGSSIPFEVDIPVAFETPEPDRRSFWAFTLIGLYVGVIPIFLGPFLVSGAAPAWQASHGIFAGAHRRAAGLSGAGHAERSA